MTPGTLQNGLHMLPLLEYAARYRFTHINSMLYDEQKTLSSLVLKLLLSSPRLSSCVQVNDLRANFISSFCRSRFLGFEDANIE